VDQVHQGAADYDTVRQAGHLVDVRTRRNSKTDRDGKRGVRTNPADRAGDSAGKLIPDAGHAFAET